MNELLDKFEQLLTEMRRALVKNDVSAVQSLTDQQQVCLSDIVTLANQDAKLKDVLRERMPGIQQQMELNDRLLKQGIDVANSVMQAIYSSRQSGDIRQSAGQYRA